MAFEKEKDAILKVLYRRDKELKSTKGLSGAAKRQMLGMTKDMIVDATVLSKERVKPALKWLYGEYITVIDDGKAWDGKVDEYVITDKGREFMEDRKSFVKELKSARYKRFFENMNRISATPISIIAIVLSIISIRMSCTTNKAIATNSDEVASMKLTLPKFDSLSEPPDKTQKMDSIAHAAKKHMQTDITTSH